MHYANTLKKAVACALLGAVATATFMPSAHAQPKFDRKLAKVLADRAASELGDLRGGYAMTVIPEIADIGLFSGTGTSATLDLTPTGAIERDLPPLPRTDIRVVYAG